MCAHYEPTKIVMNDVPIYIVKDNNGECLYSLAPNAYTKSLDLAIWAATTVQYQKKEKL